MDQWQRARRDVLDRLDIRAEYQAWGIEIVGEPRASGWIDCRAVGHEDRNPSAGVNVGTDHPLRGRYKEFVGEARSLNFFDAAVEFGPHPDYKAAFRHYLEQTGVAPPKGRPSASPSDSFDRLDYNGAVTASWCMKKGLVEEWFRRAGGERVSYGREKLPCVALPIFGEHGIDDEPCGWVLWQVSGQPFPASGGKRPKMRTAKGSSMGWLGRWGLAHLAEARTVWLVEGPTDMLALQQRLGDTLEHVVLANSGGSTERPVPERIAMLAGKRVILLRDTDESGEKGRARWEPAVAAVASELRSVRLPYTVTESGGKDLRDYFDDGHSLEDLLQLAGAAEVVGKPVLAGDEPPEPDAWDYATSVANELGIVVMGEDDTGDVSIYSQPLQKTSTVRGVDSIKLARLIQVAGPQIKEKVHTSAEPIPGLFTIHEVREAISLLGGRRIREGSEVGPGIWCGRTESGEPNDQVVLVNGGRSGLMNGKPVLDVVDSPLCGGLIATSFADEAWCDLDAVNGMLAEADDTWCRAAVEEAEELFSRWLWSTDVDAGVMAGLVVASWIQTLFAWRPQVSVTGKSDSGKSTLFDCLAEMFGSLAAKSSQSTAAGVRQEIERSARVALLDEFDTTKDRPAVLEMVRASGRGDVILRGSNNGGRVKRFRLRHIIWTAGIDSGLDKEADRNRFVRLELLVPPRERHGRLVVPEPHELAALGQRLLVVGLRHCREIVDRVRLVSKMLVKGVARRTVECYAVPACCLSVPRGDDVEATRAVLEAMLPEHDEDGPESVDDERQLLEDILGSQVQLKGDRVTVAQLLERRQLDQDASYQLATIGIGVAETGRGGHNLPADERAMFIDHKLAKRHLLRGTRWERSSVDEILLRISGARKSRFRVGGRQPWGILVPLAYVEEV